MGLERRSDGIGKRKLSKKENKKKVIKNKKLRKIDKIYIQF